MQIRTRLFGAAFGVATVSLLLAASLVSWSLQRELRDRVETELVEQARLVSQLVSRRGISPTIAELDQEADSLGRQLGTRVTLIAHNGRVVGDSAEDLMGIANMENHGSRPEILLARQSGLGVTQRFSTTIEIDFLYAALPVDHPLVGFARLALPLTVVEDQLSAVQSATAVGIVLALASALVLAWFTSTAMSSRVSSIAAVARRYAQGDLSPPGYSYGNDEVGTVARALDASVQEIGNRLNEISRQRALTDAILSSMAEGVLLVDTSGHVKMANDKVQSMLGINKPLIGCHYKDLIQQEQIAQQVQDALEKNKTTKLEVRFNTLPEKTLLASATVLPGSDGSEDKQGAVMVLHDMSEFKRAEQVRQDFVANVSHELRTPITAIRASVDALIDDEPDKESNRFLDIIARHTKRMGRLVSDLLRLARLDAGQEPLKLVLVSLPTVVSAVQTELAPLLDNKKLRIDINIDPTVIKVVVDPAKLHDVLKNLIENAANYGPSGSFIEITASKDGDDLIIKIEDQGPGIPEASLSRIFERFYRVEESRVRDPGGTGLGLSIVKHLLGLHDGTVIAGNRSGGGACFIITLPQRKTVAEEAIASPQRNSRVEEVALDI
tara:strand:- start:34274 stop:36106 length:1833 start_codon:yes stop_codon:yes gene_type:complete